MNDVLAYLPNVIVAILIFVVAALVSGAAAGAGVKIMGDTPTGKVVASVAPAVIMVIALFMILEQLQIAPEIVRIAFAAIMFALALGLALAFGLGGRELAADALRQAKDKGADAAARAKQDAQTGRDRVQGEYGSTSTAGTHAAPATGHPITSDAGYDPHATQQMQSPTADPTPTATADPTGPPSRARGASRRGFGHSHEGPHHGRRLSMEPIPETLAAIDELDPAVDDRALLGQLPPRPSGLAPSRRTASA